MLMWEEAPLLCDSKLAFIPLSGKGEIPRNQLFFIQIMLFSSGAW
jgi:hypothetical protein